MVHQSNYPGMGRALFILTSWDNLHTETIFKTVFLSDQFSDPGNSPIFRITHYSRNNGTGRASQILTEQNLNISLCLFCCFWHGLAVEFITITTIPHCSLGPDSRGLTNFPPEQTLLTGLTPGSSWHSWHSWSPEILLWWQCRQHRLVSPGVSVFIGRQGVWSRRFTSTRWTPLTCSLSD